MSNTLDPDTMRMRYEEGVKLHKGTRAQQKGEVLALSMALGGFGEVMSDSKMKRASQMAKLFCIGAVFVIPNLLMIFVALN